MSGGVPSYASKNFRNRPTVTSNSSSLNVLMVTQCSGISFGSPVGTASDPIVERPIQNVPPGTSGARQQLSPLHSVPFMCEHDGPGDPGPPSREIPPASLGIGPASYGIGPASRDTATSGPASRGELAVPAAPSNAIGGPTA